MSVSPKTYFPDARKLELLRGKAELLDGEWINSDIIVTDDIKKPADCCGDEERNKLSPSVDTDDLTGSSGDEAGIGRKHSVVTEKRVETGGLEEKLRLDLSLDTMDGSEADSSEDEETKRLVERKRQLEQEKHRLRDERQRKRQIREQRKLQLKSEVKTLENEVAELSVRDFQRRF